MHDVVFLKYHNISVSNCSPPITFFPQKRSVLKRLICKDLDIQVNNLTITELLNPWGNNEAPLPRLEVEKRPTSKFRVLDLLYLSRKMNEANNMNSTK